MYKWERKRLRELRRTRYHFNKHGNITAARSAVDRFIKRMDPEDSFSSYMHRISMDTSRRLESGYTETQTWTGLMRAWLAYCISKDQQDRERMTYYASAIQKLETELGIQVANFPDLKLYALGHKRDYAKYLADETYVDKPEGGDSEDPDLKMQKDWLLFVGNSDGLERFRY